MVLRILTYLFVITTLTACWGFAKLSMQKEDVNNTSFRTDGFYWGLSEYQGYIDIYIFYRNGTMFLFGSRIEGEIDLKRIERELQNGKSDNYIRSQASWGLFRIDDKRIEFEYWATKEKRPSKFKTKIWRAEILNDTTFVVNSVYNNYQKKTYYPDAIYHFHQFSPKPDSTNNFIK